MLAPCYIIEGGTTASGRTYYYVRRWDRGGVTLYGGMDLEFMGLRSRTGGEELILQADQGVETCFTLRGGEANGSLALVWG